MTCSVTASGVRPSWVAIRSCAVTGDLNEPQTVALSLRTSAIAQLGSSEELLRK